MIIQNTSNIHPSNYSENELLTEVRPNFELALARIKNQSNVDVFGSKEKKSNSDSFGAWFEWD